MFARGLNILETMIICNVMFKPYNRVHTQWRILILSKPYTKIIKIAHMRCRWGKVTNVLSLPRYLGGRPYQMTLFDCDRDTKGHLRWVLIMTPLNQRPQKIYCIPRRSARRDLDFGCLHFCWIIFLMQFKDFVTQLFKWSVGWFSISLKNNNIENLRKCLPLLGALNK